MDHKSLADLLDSFKDSRILVTGDPIADVYHFGSVTRMCPEAPVPVFVEERIERRNGGAANVRDQLEALGCKTENTFDLYHLWSEKHRYLQGSHMLLRIDNDQRNAAVWDGFEVHAFDAMVVSDYAKGATEDSAFIEYMEKFSAAGIPIVVDPKGTLWTKYHGCSVITPNSHEVHESTGYRTGKIGWIVEKAGERGLFLHQRVPVPNPRHFPTRANHVFDVTGAGDTVTALIAATMSVGGSLQQACELANVAAAYVVARVGTTVCPLEHLRSTVDRKAEHD